MPTKLIVELDDDLAERLAEVASEKGLTAERVAADCVAQNFAISARFLALVQRFEAIDNNLAVIAEFVGKASTSSDGEDLWRICRWRRENEKR